MIADDGSYGIYLHPKGGDSPKGEKGDLYEKYYSCGRQQFTEVIPLKKASKKYGVQFPDAKFTVIYSGFTATIFYEFDGYGIKAAPLIMPGQIGGYPNITNKEQVTDFVLSLLICNQCSMDWENSVQNYLEKSGVNYENTN